MLLLKKRGLRFETLFAKPCGYFCALMHFKPILQERLLLFVILKVQPHDRIGCESCRKSPFLSSMQLLLKGTI